MPEIRSCDSCKVCSDSNCEWVRGKFTDLHRPDLLGLKIIAQHNSKNELGQKHLNIQELKTNSISLNKVFLNELALTEILLLPSLEILGPREEVKILKHKMGKTRRQ